MKSSANKMFMKAGLVGLANSLGMVAYFGPGSITAFGTNLPLYVPAFGAGVGSSLITDLAHDYLLSWLPANEKFMSIESAALGLALSGGSNVGILMLEGVQIPRNLMLISGGIGAGSYILGDWVVEKWLDIKSPDEEYPPQELYL